jgi:hypothetical protein
MSKTNKYPITTPITTIQGSVFIDHEPIKNITAIEIMAVGKNRYDITLKVALNSNFDLPLKDWIERATPMEIVYQHSQLPNHDKYMAAFCDYCIRDVDGLSSIWLIFTGNHPQATILKPQPPQIVLG